MVGWGIVLLGPILGLIAHNVEKDDLYSECISTN